MRDRHCSSIPSIPQPIHAPLLRHWPTLRRGILLCLICVGMIGWHDFMAAPAWAAGQGNSSLEQQVLQIIRAHPEVILESVQDYQQREYDKQQQAQRVALKELQTHPEVLLFNAPTQGARDRRLLLVEFSDFQCPYCAKAQAILKQFVAKHPDTVTLVYKHYPLTEIHAESLTAAQAAWAAGQQGQFWAYHDALFKHQANLNQSVYTVIAKELKLDLEQFNRDRTSPESILAITADQAIANQLGISGTPFFLLINTANPNSEAITLEGAISLDNLEAALRKVTQA